MYYLKNISKVGFSQPDVLQLHGGDFETLLSAKQKL
jgi:hypothetical protein